VLVRDQGDIQGKYEVHYRPAAAHHELTRNLVLLYLLTTLATRNYQKRSNETDTAERNLQPRTKVTSIEDNGDIGAGIDNGQMGGPIGDCPTRRRCEPWTSRPVQTEYNQLLHSKPAP
jgi:hypothetical protein